MAKGYWIAHITVTDEANYPKYVAATRDAFEKYGARFVVRGGRSQLREGEARQRHVVIEFDSYDAALACYESDEYAPALALRQQYAIADLVIVEGPEQAGGNEGGT